MNTRRVKAHLFVAAVFLLGAAAGGGASYAYVERRHAALLRDDGGRGFEDRRIRGLARKLDLDDAQETQVRAILDQDRAQVRDLSRDMFEHCGQPLRDHKAKVDADIRAVLRPDQQARYDQLVDERREHTWMGRR